jgi:hypothetical protein
VLSYLHVWVDDARVSEASKRPRVDQRRSPRYATDLSVQVHGRGGVKDLRTVDVSRHGIFVASSEPEPVRQLVRLTIVLPDGPLPATAFVVRVINDPERGVQGMGLQLFALAALAKTRWDEFIHRLAGEAIPRPNEPSRLTRSGPGGATFLVKRKSVAALLEFYETTLEAGTLYITTPVLKEKGAEVALIVVHPDTQEEHILWGVVQRVRRDEPKGMEIKISELSAEDRRSFRVFIDEGKAPAPPSEPSRPAAIAVKSLHVVPLSPALAALPPVELDTPMTMTIDITVDESALEQSESFEWGDVYDSGLVIDFTKPEIANEAQEPKPAAPSKVRARCEKCSFQSEPIDIDQAPGLLSRLVHRVPYWCAWEEKLSSALRVKPGSDVETERKNASRDDLDEQMTIGVALELLELAASPRCPECRQELSETPLSRAFAAAIAKLVSDGESVRFDAPRCPECRGTSWSCERVA